MTEILNFFVFRDDEEHRIRIQQTKSDNSIEEIELTDETAKILIQALQHEIGVN